MRLSPRPRSSATSTARHPPASPKNASLFSNTSEWSGTGERSTHESTDRRLPQALRMYTLRETSTPEEDAMLLQKLHHVAYRCTDAGKTVDFYTNVLGLK